ncbi:hypothetical protein ACET3Z_022059 [Daucus carota]
MAMNVRNSLCLCLCLCLYCIAQVLLRSLLGNLVLVLPPKGPDRLTLVLAFLHYFQQTICLLIQISSLQLILFCLSTQNWKLSEGEDWQQGLRRTTELRRYITDSS